MWAGQDWPSGGWTEGWRSGSVRRLWGEGSRKGRAGPFSPLPGAPVSRPQAGGACSRRLTWDPCTRPLFPRGGGLGEPADRQSRGPGAALAPSCSACRPSGRATRPV